MRKTLHILLIAFAALLFTTCQKKPELQVCHLELTEETVSASDNSVTITAKYSYPGEIPEIKVCVSQHKNMSDAVENKAALTDSTLRATVKNLDSDTKYYYRYRYSNGIGLIDTEINEFTTQHLVALPTVTTIAVSAITAHSAVSGGNITDSGESDIIARGVCWDTLQNPTIDNSHTEDGTGTGGFISHLSDLNGYTAYYVRAYATNNEGTSYGNEIMFVTGMSAPTVITEEVTEINFQSAICGGEVTDDGGLPVTARGVCWSTEHDPTTENAYTTDGEGPGAFISNITGLTVNTTYYVRAYATNSIGTNYGSEVSFTSNGYPGTVNSLFSVSDTKKVYFSKGNLQYQATTNTWRFAENQYDIIGADNRYISEVYNGWIDLFGWGTSGYDHGAVCYQPWSIGNNYSYYYAYGFYIYDLNQLTGQADWGYNAISNGGDIENRWCTLTMQEWDYLFNTRNTISGVRYAKARVNGVYGVILLPDDWIISNYNLHNVNTNNADYSSNTISANIWASVLEANGAVFLPGTGYRKVNTISSLTYGYYWSATHYNENGAYGVYINDTDIATDYSFLRYYGRSVRLVYSVVE